MKKFALLCVLILICLGLCGVASWYEIPLPPSTDGSAKMSLPGKVARMAYGWRSPLGPGLVRWHLSSAEIVGYSVLTEEREHLAWAGASPVAADAIYQRAWGCRVALKIPDSCSVDVYPDHLIASCNLLAAQFGNVPHWVTPGSQREMDWPPCPLP